MQVARFFRQFLITAVACSALSAQQVTIRVDQRSRPISEALMQLQKLTDVPIHYEDLQDYSAADLQAPLPAATAVVPKGGSFSVNVPTDPTGKLPDDLSVATALNAVIAAAQSAGAVPGTFRVDSSHGGVFFVEPASHHSSTGAAVPTQPVLDTPVNVSLQEVPGIKALDAILQQVSQKTGAGLDDGMGTFFSGPKVSITATNEPAKYVLARLLADVAPSGTLSYAMLCGPNQRYYAFNIRNPSVFQPPPRSQPYSPPPLVPSGNRLGASKKNN